jgi:low affinity Fe/Cu permease
VLKHPADRSAEQSRGRFERLAERASFLASSQIFAVSCFAIVVAWALGLILGASDRFEAATAGAMSAMTLALVALLKNAELRGERAIQQKLDAIAASLLEDKRGEVGDAAAGLEGAIGLHEEI